MNSQEKTGFPFPQYQGSVFFSVNSLEQEENEARNQRLKNEFNGKNVKVKKQGRNKALSEFMHLFVPLISIAEA